jgi:L-amino acid N-acyltransferase YncA
MQKILGYARKRGLHTVYGDVLAENRPMLGLTRSLGFESDRDPGDPAIVRVTLDLRT